jgi:hypothetical protein
MCTVTFIPANDQYFITSNRDEKPDRKKAMAPGLFGYNGEKLFYPKDGDAGGTWIVMKENGDAAVLLNGAFICHKSEAPYRLSRGIILLDIISTKKPSAAFGKIDLLGIEPFTIVLLENNCLYEFRWDGIEKYYKLLDVNIPHVWCSSTLYDGFAVRKKEQRFVSFLKKYPSPTQQDILAFHNFFDDEVYSNTLLKVGDEIYRTVSITNILLTKDLGCINYIDIKNNSSSEVKIELLPSPHTME